MFLFFIYINNKGMKGASILHEYTNHIYIYKNPAQPPVMVYEDYVEILSVMGLPGTM